MTFEQRDLKEGGDRSGRGHCRPGYPNAVGPGPLGILQGRVPQCSRAWSPGDEAPVDGGPECLTGNVRGVFCLLLPASP